MYISAILTYSRYRNRYHINKKRRKKKKKKLEKNKQNLDKNGFNLLNKVKQIDENKIEPPKLTLNNQINKEHGFKGNIKDNIYLKII